MNRIIQISCIGTIFLFAASCHDITFDSERWKNWEENEIDMFMRGDMVNDLMRNYGLTGKSLHDIEELLGKQEVACKSENCTISYDLGPCRNSGIDYGALSIRFEKGKVVEIKRSCH